MGEQIRERESDSNTSCILEHHGLLWHVRLLLGHRSDAAGSGGLKLLWINLTAAVLIPVPYQQHYDLITHSSSVTSPAAHPSLTVGQAHGAELMLGHHG